MFLCEHQHRGVTALTADVIPASYRSLHFDCKDLGTVTSYLPRCHGHVKRSKNNKMDFVFGVSSVEVAGLAPALQNDAVCAGMVSGLWG